jgi:DNA-binding response OmpR family regulator
LPPGIVAVQACGLAAAKIAVVENDPSVLASMRTLLDRWGCEGRFALGFGDIERLIAEEPDFRPDVVLADYHLDHGGSGVGAVARLRATWGSELPAIVITADHSTEVTKEAQQAGCEILRKPVKPAELRALITHLLR